MGGLQRKLPPCTLVRTILGGLWLGLAQPASAAQMFVAPRFLLASVRTLEGCYFLVTSRGCFRLLLVDLLLVSSQHWRYSRWAIFCLPCKDGLHQHK